MINKSFTQPIFILQVEPDCKYKFVFVNKGFFNILGLKEVDVVNKCVDEIIGEPSLNLSQEKFKEAIDKQETVQWEEDMPDHIGFKKAIVTITPLFDPNENCTHLLGILYDVEQNGRREEFTITDEKQLVNIINNIGDPIFVKDDQSRLLLVNDAFCSIFELSRNNIIGKTLAEQVPLDERESFLKIDKEVIETGVENVNEESLTIRGGETRIISTKKSRFVDEKGNRFLIGIIRDITNRNKAELDLKLAKEFTDRLIMSMQEGLIIVDTEGKIILVNDSICKMLGYSEE